MTFNYYNFVLNSYIIKNLCHYNLIVLFINNNKWIVECLIYYNNIILFHEVLIIALALVPFTSFVFVDLFYSNHN